MYNGCHMTKRKAQCLFRTRIKCLYFGIKKSYISTKNVVVIPGNVHTTNHVKKPMFLIIDEKLSTYFFVMVLFFLYYIVMVMLLKQRVCFVCSSNMLLC